MTHRDGFPRFSARSAWRGDAVHRKPRATPSESLGKPPFRSRGRTAGGRRQALTMPRIARGLPAERHGIEVIDLSGTIDLTERRYRIAEDNYHQSAEANEVLAARLAADLRGGPERDL